MGSIENFPFGVGGNCHMKYAKEKYQKGVINANVSLSPHSTYFGILGELGVFGLVAILIFYYYLYQLIRTSLNQNTINFNTGILSCSIFFYIALSGITMDNMNIRLYWILIGIYLLSLPNFFTYSNAKENHELKTQNSDPCTTYR